jgi:hypothetical protein
MLQALGNLINGSLSQGLIRFGIDYTHSQWGQVNDRIHWFSFNVELVNKIFAFGNREKGRS